MVWKNIPVAVVDLCLCAEQLSLTGLVGKVTTDLVTVLLCLQHGDKVDTRPHLFASEFAVGEKVSICFFLKIQIRPIDSVDFRLRLV